MSCPVCAILALIRRERPELANRLAAHVSELAAALRDAVTDEGPVTRQPAADPRAARRVQHVPVDRDGVAGRPEGRTAGRTAGGTPC
jgi:hypothetical protein